MKRLAMLVLGCAVIMAVFVGCGQSSGQKKVIKLATQLTNQEGASPIYSAAYEWVLATEKKFQTDHPDYVVQHEYIGNSAIEAKLMADFAAGVNHDVVLTQTTDLPQWASIGGLYDMTKYFEQLPQDEQKDFNWHPAWPFFDLDGKLLALPMGLHVRTIAYRKDLFKAAGLDPKVPPKDYNELVEDAKKLTIPGKQWGMNIYMGWHVGSLESVFFPNVWSRGGDFYDKATKMATFTTPAVMDTIQWYLDCVYKYKITPLWDMEGDQNQNMLNPLIDGRAAMSFGIGNYWLANLQSGGLLKGAYPPSAKVDDSKIGWFIMPEKGGVTYTNAWSISISASTKQPDMAWQLLRAATDKEVMKKYIAFGGFPGRLSGYSAPEYQADFWKNWLAIIKTARPGPMTPNFNNLEAALQPAMQKIISTNDGAHMKSILQQAQDAYNSRYGGK